ncbi:hypothetical protein FH609_024795 [Streptomyces sp. 3MP-14]|uniref:Outer membrane channel protein CpnT-like N-terminal domain-containing protein n=1 Tax=Streptomyces mimosae TaxID=2586635 RepID=A0A5N6A098_9ACTN|nr:MULTISPECIES: hypothetical protein [Streptomyces]KAB8162161.1 hypothetical protein FH607_021940 [Streptomyces mimosae]KAB8173941.1 hypothetical protein FH609_024795 [Streptomyces sp. 3MP-14]
MSITLPGWLAEVVDWLGFNWPDIDEDELREAADGLRAYAQDCQDSMDTTTGVVGNDLERVYQAQSYGALAESWGQQSSQHMRALVDGCELLADGLDAAALAVEGMKVRCIAQLGIAAGQMAAALAASAATLGVASASAVATQQLQRRLVNEIVERFEEEAIGALVDGVIGPVQDQITSAVQRLLQEEAAEIAAGEPLPTIRLNTDEMRAFGDTILGQAEASLSSGELFSSKVTGLTFTTGG